MEDSSVKPQPLERHLQLETDHFCHGCGYNLHGQIVTRDERLDFLICRCPECGRFHPAAMGVSATRPWLARLGVMLVAQWVVIVLTVFGLVGLFMGMCNYVHLETYTENVGGYGYNERPVRQLRQFGNTYWEQRRREEAMYFAGISAILATALGLFTAVATWHRPRTTQWRFLFFPLLVGLFVLLVWNLNENIEQILVWSILWIIGYAVLNVGGMALGLVIGRPVARAVVKLFIPPKLRQHVNFLWQCDGLAPPALPSP